MANTTLTADIIANEALLQLDNQLGWLGQLHRGHESEFSKKVNGYTVGESISIRRPADFTVRSGAAVSTQDVIEGKVTLTVDQQIGVDFQFTSADLELQVSEMSDRIIKPAMSRIVNFMAKDIATIAYKGFYNWVGTPGQTINSFADFAKAPERLDECGVPMEGRVGLLAPTDHWALLGSQTSLYMQDVAKSAYRSAQLGSVADINMFMSQVVPSHLTGSRDDSTPLTDGNSQEVTYNTAKDTWSQTIVTDGWDASVTLLAGDVFTIDGVFMVNPATKQSTGILQQFVVNADVTANGTTSADTNIVVSPPVIIAGPHQTVTYSGNFDGRAIVPMGAASTNYRQNMVFHKDSIALACVPLALPPGATGGSTKSHKGFSVRLQPFYDGVNDISKWRLDMLYGRSCIDRRAGVRISGTSG
jgi:hypothetical protein